MKTKPMSFEEHRELGQKVREVVRLLNDIFSTVSRHYGKSHLMNRALRSAQRSVDKMQCRFDDVAGNEHDAEHGDAVNKLYYGRPEKESDDINRRLANGDGRNI